MIRLLFAFALLTASAARAQDYCVDFLAAASTKFDCDTALLAFEGVPRPCMNFLMRTFGDDLSCIFKFAELPGEKTLKIIATNQSCCRLNRCEGFDKACGTESIQFRVLEAVGLANLLMRPDMKILISAGLEHAWKKAKQAKIFEYARSLWPGTLINNPVGHDANFADLQFADVVELHALKSNFRGKACAFSNDGFDVNLSKRRWYRSSISVSTLLSAIRRHRKGCHYLSIWWNTQGAGGKFKRPSRRRLKIYRSDVFRINHILRHFYEQN
jgi:hypothetical protein